MNYFWDEFDEMIEWRGRSDDRGSDPYYTSQGAFYE